MEDPKLSLILPCYCEQSHLDVSLARVVSFLDYWGISYEVILVEDCSPDDTALLVREATRRYDHVRALYHEVNKGRGAAVMTGLRAARGSFVGFIDVDLEVDVCYIPALLMELERGADVATGWRHYNVSVTRVIRFIASKIYQHLSRWMVGVRLNDTETGCKFFRRAAIVPVAEKTAAQGWFWDTEIMVRAKLAGLRIVEVPVLFKRRPEKPSTVRLIPDSLNYCRHLWRFRRQLLRERDQSASRDPVAGEAEPVAQASDRQ